MWYADEEDHSIRFAIPKMTSFKWLKASAAVVDQQIEQEKAAKQADKEATPMTPGSIVGGEQIQGPRQFIEEDEIEMDVIRDSDVRRR